MGETFPYRSFVKNGFKNQIKQGHELGVKRTHTQKKNFKKKTTQSTKC